jgi:glycosyltransferase involved in cell wall biosynthesis
MMKFDFCLPIYNEEEIIADSLSRLSSYLAGSGLAVDWRIIVISNGSTDRSDGIASALVSERIRFVRLPEKGRGRALKKYWLDSDADVVSYMDSDLAVALGDIPALVVPFLNDSADLVIGSRLLPGSHIERSVLREAMSRSCNLAYRLATGYRVSDTQCGFKAVRTDSFRSFAGQITDPGWFFDTELITFALVNGYRLKEVPVRWEEARYDQRKSKVKVMRDSWGHIKNLWRLRQRLKAAANRGYKI